MYLKFTMHSRRTCQSNQTARSRNSSKSVEVKLVPASFLSVANLDHLYSTILDLDPFERSKLLETTSIFSEIHAESASSGQTAAPTADTKVDLHFTCFVAAPDPQDPTKKRLIELDGRRLTPVDRGPCSDLLGSAARAIKECYVDTASSLQFSMLALAPPPQF